MIEPQYPDSRTDLGYTDADLQETAATREAVNRNLEQYRELITWIDHGPRLHVACILAEQRMGVGYQELEERTDADKRQLQYWAKELVELEIIERKGRPATMYVKDEDTHRRLMDVCNIYLETRE